MPLKFEIANGWRYEAFHSGGDGDYGDASIYAPDGSNCGLAWAHDDSAYFARIMEADDGRWGVFGVGFAELATTADEIRQQLLPFLPQLEAAWQAWKQA